MHAPTPSRSSKQVSHNSLVHTYTLLQHNSLIPPPTPSRRYKQVPHNSLAGVMAALAVQPLAISVDATNFGTYGGGIFENCGVALNHGERPPLQAHWPRTP